MNIADLIKNFSLLQTNDPCVFIMRHAEKPIVNNMYADIANAITEAGVKSSRKLGNILSVCCPKIGIVRSSPIARCLETASNIFSEYSYKIPIIPDTDLGGDGAYVSDNQLAAQYFLENPSRKDIFIRMQEGESFSGMREISAGTRLLLTKINHDLESLTAPGFYITHDCILALFVGAVVDKIVDEKNWFQYLDGVCIKKTNNRVLLYWGKECFDITEKSKNLS
jgi:hypothetical protein